MKTTTTHAHLRLRSVSRTQFSKLPAPNIVQDNVMFRAFKEAGAFKRDVEVELERGRSRREQEREQSYQRVQQRLADMRGYIEVYQTVRYTGRSHP